MVVHFCKIEKIKIHRSTPHNSNSLQFVSPKLSIEWHPNKNGNLTPDQVCGYSNQIVWWKCSCCGNEWKSSVNSRMKSKHQLCPKAPTPVNKEKSLGFLEPEISDEFISSNNSHISPNNISLGSHYKIQWKCRKCGCLWSSSAYDRVRGYNNCPNCSHKIILKDGTICASLIEAYYYLKYKSEKIRFLHNKKYGGLGIMGNCRYDFYFPSKKTYIEVTSFQKGFKKWFSYLRRIVKKKQYVENILKRKFVFIKENLTIKQIKYINDNRRKDIRKVP